MIVSIPPGGSGSGGGGSTPAPAAGSIDVQMIETTGAFSIPAGALWLEIRNAGQVQIGDLEEEATVGAATWSVGRVERWESVFDSASNEFLTLPALTGDGNGARVFITYALPVLSGGGGGGGSLPTAGTLTVTSTETTGAFSIPAGALWVEIRNAGIVQPGDLEADATVGAATWSVGRVERWESVFDTASNEFLRLPALTGDGNGSRVFITYAA